MSAKDAERKLKRKVQQTELEATLATLPKYWIKPSRDGKFVLWLRGSVMADFSKYDVIGDRLYLQHFNMGEFDTVKEAKDRAKHLESPVIQIWDYDEEKKA